MKKVFPFKVPGKADPGVVESVKLDVRKYVKRERRKALPKGFSQWNLACRAGSSAAAATECDLPGLIAMIDEVAAAGGTEIYLEILATPGHRPPPKEAAPPPMATDPDPSTPDASG